MQLLKKIVMMAMFFPSLAIANNCAILVKLESPYLQNQAIYLDEILSQPVVNNQLCLSHSEATNNTEPYYLELFSDNGSNLDSLLIFPEYYIDRDVITITTADLLTHFCRQCHDVNNYRQFISLPAVKNIAQEMDVIVANKPHLMMLDVIKQTFQQALLDLYNQDLSESVVSTNGVDIDVANKINKVVKQKDKYIDKQRPDHLLPMYGGAELQNFIPQGLQLNHIDSLPLASYSIDATAAAVVDFYRSHYPEYKRISFGNFVMLVKNKLPFEGYNPEYMAIPHIVISEDPLGKGKTLLQITYRPESGEIKGTREMMFKPVT